MPKSGGVGHVVRAIYFHVGTRSCHSKDTSRSAQTAMEDQIKAISFTRDTVERLKRMAGDDVEHGGRILEDGTICMDTNGHAGTDAARRNFTPSKTRHTRGLRFHTHPLAHTSFSENDILAFCEEYVLRNDHQPAMIMADRSCVHVLCLPERFLRLTRHCKPIIHGEAARTSTSFRQRAAVGTSRKRTTEEDDANLQRLQDTKCMKIARELHATAGKIFNHVDKQEIRRRAKVVMYNEELRKHGINVQIFPYRMLLEHTEDGRKPFVISTACH